MGRCFETEILGQRYLLEGGRPAELMKVAAEEVRQRLAATSTTEPVAQRELLIVVALDLAADLLEERERFRIRMDQAQERSRRILRLLDGHLEKLTS